MDNARSSATPSASSARPAGPRQYSLAELAQLQRIARGENEAKIDPRLVDQFDSLQLACHRTQPAEERLFKRRFETYYHRIGQDYSVPSLGKDFSALLTPEARATDRALTQMATTLATGVRTVESVFCEAAPAYARDPALSEQFYFVLNDLNVVFHRALGQISEFRSQQLLKLGNAEPVEDSDNLLLSPAEFVSTVDARRAMRESLAASVSKGNTSQSGNSGGGKKKSKCGNCGGGGRNQPAPEPSAPRQEASAQREAAPQAAPAPSSSHGQGRAGGSNNAQATSGTGGTGNPNARSRPSNAQ
ncbi:hypothetical protein FB639_002769 [Coemansia asiatica]|nr:hypothetical protein FB639_002769 [Coemansia asiatica]